MQFKLIKYAIQNHNLCHKFTKMYLFILELLKNLQFKFIIMSLKL